jgi:hypothetical protein
VYTPDELGVPDPDADVAPAAGGDTTPARTAALGERTGDDAATAAPPRGPLRAVTDVAPH